MGWLAGTGKQLRCGNYKICPPGSCGAYFSASWVSTMVKDREDGSYWIGSNDGLLQFWPASGALQVYRPPALLAGDGRPHEVYF